MSELIKPQNLVLSTEQLAMLMPYLIVAAGAMLTLLAGVIRGSSDPEANRRKRNLAAVLVGIATVTAGLLYTAKIWGEPGAVLFNGMLAADYYTGLMNAVFLAATGLVMLSSYSYLEKERIHHAEYYSLALFSCLGMMLMASALDLIVLFVALEMMSLGVYVMVGFRRADVRSNEAAVKYFILGSAVSAIFLYGVALLYGATGSMNIAQLATSLKSDPTGNPLLALGAVLVTVGFLFKIASVPFHMWMPDVYEGAPTSVTNFMTTGLKAAAFAAFLRVFIGLNSGGQGGGGTEGGLDASLHDVLWVVALVTMFIGNVIALTQKNIKRMLAYSSIAHSGYILVGLISGGKSEYGYSSVILYLIAYVVMNLGAFAIVAHLSERGDRRCDVEDYAGLGYRHPWLSFAMAVFMFSMAGVPPTVGFAGKYLIFSSAVQAGEIWLAVLGVLCSAIGAYYYLRVIVFMYMREPARAIAAKFAPAAALVVLVATAGTLQFGVFPSMLIHAAKKAAMNI
ncbi:MAG: NADH-quinone oxidoreductase subunit N [Deltaproteobacteria bacterium]|nr:NADH-quinone oxidoreductase subunit N [Deltaproteobacteria bacterium]